MTLYATVAATAETLAGESSRLKKRGAIEAALRDAQESFPEKSDAGLLALYLAGQPFAENDPRKLNAGAALLSRAVLAASGASDAALTAAYRRHGDLGAAAFDLLVAPYGNAPSDATLTLGDVAEVFDAMAVARTTAARSAMVEGLLRRATALEAKYLLKLMLGDMRIGVKQSLVEEAIAFAACAEVIAVRHAVMLEADLARAVARAFAGTLGEARMTLFHPLGFMLASPVETPEEAVARFTEAPAKVIAPKKGRKKKGLPEDLVAVDAAEIGLAEDVEAEASLSSPSAAKADAAAPVLAFLEDKYDGMRAQVHCGYTSQPGRVAIYSRNREDITHSFPALEEAFSAVDGPLILDGEILGWDYAIGQALPFAVMGQRIGRKVVSNELRTRIPVVFMAFDLLYEGEQLLLPLPLTERRARLEAVVARWRSRVVSPLTVDAARKAPQQQLFAREMPPEDAKERFLLSPSQRVADAEAIDVAYRDARARANEGVMLKAANSAYLPGRRGLAWVKLKRELATLDVVITGAEFGHGKRAGLLSDYTFAVRGEDGELLNVGKAYSGVTDAEIAELTEWLKAHTLEDRGHFRTVEPQIVLEVAFNNIMRSTRHASGFAMRFPRIIRIRTDKPVEEIDTLARVEEIYQSQPDRPADSAE
ncbi:MAG TPA: ATP-dependent DNA ligase [Acidobacteriaceae bacterium]|nr:ATP-dependent DNA ligase [Acidobacteriaceae bacterium]